MDPESLIRSTFDDLTYFEAPCIPGKLLYLDFLDDVDDAPDLKDYVTAFSQFLELSPIDLRKAEPYAFAMYNEFKATVDPSCLDVAVNSPEEVWRELQFEGVNLVRGTDSEQNVYVQLPVDCSWDQEHGMQFVFLNGSKLTGVSEQDGTYHICNTLD